MLCGLPDQPSPPSLCLQDGGHRAHWAPSPLNPRALRAPLLQATGGIIDAHDGSVQLLDGPRGEEFFGHLMGYGFNLATGDPADCPENGHWCVNCGRHLNNTVGVWTSTTLAPGSWVHRAQAMVPGRDGWPPGEYYRRSVHDLCSRLWKNGV